MATSVPYFELKEVLGAQAALRIVQTYGGIGLYVPKRIKPGSDLWNILSDMTIVQAFENSFGGEQLEIPIAKAAQRAAVYELVAENKLTKTDAARALGMTVRHVRRVMNAGGSSQGDLFS